MRTLIVVLALGLAATASDAAMRRPVSCCIMVPADDGVGERPYCFVLKVKPARYGRRVCKLVGGMPHPAVDRR